MDWNREKIKECLEILATLPDFENLLFPDNWAKEYNIPITPGRVIDLKEYIKKHKQSQIVGGAYSKPEIREPTEGGVREITVEDKLEIEHKFAVVDNKQEFGFTLEDKKEEEMPELQTSPTGTTEESVPFDGNGATGEC